MTEEQFREDFYISDFKPVRLHLVSGKTIDIMRIDAVMPLRDRLMVFKNLAKDGHFAEGYDVIAMRNIERMEQLVIGKRAAGSKKN